MRRNNRYCFWNALFNRAAADRLSSWLDSHTAHMPKIFSSTFLDTYRPHGLPLWQKMTSPVANSEIARSQHLQTRVPMRVKHIFVALLVFAFDVERIWLV